jgi:hypothetical protein
MGGGRLVGRDAADRSLTNASIEQAQDASPYTCIGHGFEESLDQDLFKSFTIIAVADTARLRQMRDPDALLPGEVGYRARQLEDAVIGPRAQPHALDRNADHLVSVLVELTKLLHLGRPHVSVDQHMRLAQLCKARLLN